MTPAEQARKLLDSVLDRPLTDDQAVALAEAYIRLGELELGIASLASQQPAGGLLPLGASMGTG